MIIGEWQDEKPTEPGLWFIMSGDVEVEDNLFFVRVKRDAAGVLYDADGPEPTLLEDFPKSFQWAKVYLGSEAKEYDELFPGTLDQLNNL